ncbi:hypothetical protein [Glycomyces xiaoerkulensis]|uniref:hypothetical protein n=1 Tax=Glycomyces xiaoerkulensis TaxID=2038139 RepID=UPI000C267304|nr:hypothetical protein [Glycomyces xiaoerkulensis]
MGARRLCAAALLAALPLAGCGIAGDGQGSGCVDTELEARDVAVGEETEPFTLTGVLTAGGEPVEGAELGFFMHREEEDGHVKVTTAGSGVTDAEGRAERSYEGGPRDIGAFSTEEVVGYSVEYRQVDLIDEVRYCDARSGRVELEVPCAGFGCEFGEG